MQPHLSRLIFKPAVHKVALSLYFDTRIVKTTRFYRNSFRGEELATPLGREHEKPPGTITSDGFADSPMAPMRLCAGFLRQAAGTPQVVDLVGTLPGELGQLAAEVAVGGRFAVDGTA